jgi:hypothetical protein
MCPRREIGWHEATPLGPSAAQLVGLYTRERTLPLVRGDTAKLFGERLPGPNVRVRVEAAPGGVASVGCPHLPPSLNVPARVTFAFGNAGEHEIELDGILTATSVTSVSMSGTAEFPTRSASLGLWMGGQDAELLVGPEPMRWSSLCSEQPEPIAAKAWNRTVAELVAGIRPEHATCQKEGGPDARPIAPLPLPALQVVEVGPVACRNHAFPSSVSVPVRAAATSTDGWLRHELRGHLTMESTTRTGGLEVEGSVPMSASMASLLGCSATKLAKVRVRARLDAAAATTHFEYELSSSCEDSMVRCSAHPPR